MKNNFHFKKDLAGRFSSQLEFELGSIKDKSLTNKNIIKPFSSSLFLRFSNSPMLSDLSLFYTYFNDYSLDLPLKKQGSLNAVDLFFDDTFALDELMDSRQIYFKNYSSGWDKTFPLSAFHYDNYPYYNPDFELNNFVQSFNPEDAIWTKFPSSGDKPYGLFLERLSEKARKLQGSKIQDIEAKKVTPYYYLSKAFMSILMDEERYYSYPMIFVKSLFILILIPFAAYLISLHYLEFWGWTYHDRYSWIGTDYRKFWLDVGWIINNPTAFILKLLFVQTLVIKMTIISVHDAILFSIFKGNKNKNRKRFAFFFSNRKRRRIKYGKILQKWFW